MTFSFILLPTNTTLQLVHNSPSQVFIQRLTQFRLVLQDVQL